jgi:hypothetical protein
MLTAFITATQGVEQNKNTLYVLLKFLLTVKGQCSPFCPSLPLRNALAFNRIGAIMGHGPF